MRGLNGILISLALAIVIIAMSFFTVYETDRALIMKFKKIKTDGEGKEVFYKPVLKSQIPVLMM